MICLKGTKTDFRMTRGIAKMNSVCWALSGFGGNCAFSTVLNFMDSWPLAHEIGHALGANHDKMRNGCERGIMGPSIERPFVWSNCSNNEISALLVEPAYGVCLYNEPDPSKIIWDFKRDRSIPGHKYGADRQCAQYFGPKYTKYKNDVSWLPPVVTNPCEDLWCSYDLILVSAKCALEGTECVLNNRPGRCKVGQCVS